MARAKSPEKRRAILDAAIHEIARAGLGASTASIAKRAAVAEGTLFTYFDTKDDLLNALYLDLKAEVYRRIDTGFPVRAGLQQRARHIWTEYLLWAIERPEARKVSVQLHVSNVLDTKTREQGLAMRGLTTETMREVDGHGAFKAMPPGFASSAMTAMQEAVLDLIARKAKEKKALIERAFETYWRMAK